MTARTHDLFAISGLIGIIALGIVPKINSGTAIVTIGAAFLGGMIPDLDESGAQFWRRIPTGIGTILGKIVAPIFGSHRFVSHSIVGLVIFSWLFYKILGLASGFLVVNINIVTAAFIIGIGSHMVADGLTREGIPLLWPLPIKFGFPPIKIMRIETGGWMEKVYFVALVIADVWLVTNFRTDFLRLVRGLV